jgi:hypothetical protein
MLRSNPSAADRNAEAPGECPPGGFFVSSPRAKMDPPAPPTCGSPWHKTLPEGHREDSGPHRPQPNTPQQFPRGVGGPRSNPMRPDLKKKCYITQKSRYIDKKTRYTFRMSNPTDPELIPAAFRVRHLGETYFCDQLIVALHVASVLTDGGWDSPATIDEWNPAARCYQTRNRFSPETRN